MIELARDNPVFRPVVDRFVRGEPDAILLTEFAGDDADDNLRRLRQLVELMGDLGFPDSVIEATDPGFQSAVWNVRKEGLNIMMSMKGDGKPISLSRIARSARISGTDQLTRHSTAPSAPGTPTPRSALASGRSQPEAGARRQADARSPRKPLHGARMPGSHSGSMATGCALRAPRAVRPRSEGLRGGEGHFDPTGSSIRARSRLEDGRPQPLPLQAGYRQLPLDGTLDWSD
jgi:hypothetical protein